LSTSYDWPAEAPRPAIAPFTAEQAKHHQSEWAEYLGLPVEWENSLGMKFRLIPPGEFVMGSTNEERMLAMAEAVARKDDEWKLRIASEAPQHRVVLTQPFYIGQHEVTQSQYQRLIGNNPSLLSEQGNFKSLVEGIDTATHPVTEVYYREVVQFCLRLCEAEQLSACFQAFGDEFQFVEAAGYRLPTEAQWEFACRAGTTSLYCTGCVRYLRHARQRLGMDAGLVARGLVPEFG
jgi:formylglycine-generating enzyme required for sulfatase activity